ncbi:hypothetical protein [Embleya sp. NBC_00888]|uniref:hypothetical protein n=1 Tax=Embleya sp. NBC_00888 TaxID=2975960 RepID=UPI002F908FD3
MTATDHMAAFLTRQPRRRVDFDALAGAADARDSSLATSPRRRRILADAAHTLAHRGLITLPKGTDGWDHSAHPPLPRWVQRPAAPRPPSHRPRPHAYFEQLRFTTTLRLTAGDHALLGPVNALLRDDPDAEIIPLADRSYQLYGDEKRLKDIERHHLVTKGLLDVTAHLRARPTPSRAWGRRGWGRRGVRAARAPGRTAACGTSPRSSRPGCGTDSRPRPRTWGSRGVRPHRRPGPESFPCHERCGTPSHAEVGSSG